ncbi:hypothetical protein Tco_1162254, partial [Tanacetum coccineum]
MNSLDKNSIERADLLKAINGVTEILKAIQQATVDFSCLKSLVTNVKAALDPQNDHLETWAKSSTSMAWNIGPRLTKIKHTQAFMLGSDDEIPPPLQTPTQQAPHTVSTIKLPILKKGEYDMWAMKMEHYLRHTDYPIWEVIQKGNGPLQIDLQAEVERERQREEEAFKAAIAEMYDEVQAGIDVDALFAAKLQQEEREEAAQRSAEIRSRPPTKSQLRNLMMAYLKNMGCYKHSQLKAKTFVEIQGLYERQKRVIDDFKPMDSDDAVKDSKEAAGVHKQKVLEEPKVEVKQDGHEESIRKRPGRRLKMKAT